MVLFAFNLQSWNPPPSPPRHTPVPDRHGNLRFTFTTASSGNEPLYPATYVQLSCVLDRRAPFEIFLDDTYVSRDVATVQPAATSPEAGPRNAAVYAISVPASRFPQARPIPGVEPKLIVNLYAWQGPKLLGKYELGELKGEGYFLDDQVSS